MPSSVVAAFGVRQGRAGRTQGSIAFTLGKILPSSPVLRREGILAATWECRNPATSCPHNLFLTKNLVWQAITAQQIGTKLEDATTYPTVQMVPAAPRNREQ
jgi:hypothetical protein